MFENRHKWLRPGTGSIGRPGKRSPSARLLENAPSVSPVRTAAAAHSPQRHSVLTDQEDAHRYKPFNHLARRAGAVRSHQLPLSEYAVLGFEYGYAGRTRHAELWEAQFGDFANGAQIIIDQYISLGRTKWCASPASSVSCPTDTTVRGRNIPRRGSSAICNVRRRQHPGRQLHHAGQLLPHFAAPAETQFPQAAHPDDAQVAAASQACGVAA